MKRIIMIIMFLLVALIGGGFFVPKSNYQPVHAQSVIAQQEDCRYTKDKSYTCVEGIGCGLEENSTLVFNKSVEEMAAEMGWDNFNYRPCYMEILSNKDSYSLRLYNPLEYKCDYYFRLCGITERNYVSAWTSGEQGDTLNMIVVFLERHIPNYVPIAIERSGWDNQDWTKGDTILMPAPGYPPPIEPTKQPPYP